MQLNKSIYIVFLFFYLLKSLQLCHSKVYWLTSEDGNISEELDKWNCNEFLGNFETQTVNYMYDVDLNSTCSLKVSDINVDTAIGVQNLNSISNKRKKLNNFKFTYQFENSETTIPSDPIQPYFNITTNKNEEPEVLCNYTIISPTFDVVTYSSKRRYKKLVPYFNDLVGLSDDGNLYIIHSSLEGDFDNQAIKIDNATNVVNFFIKNNVGKNNVFLIFTKKENNGNYSFYGEIDFSINKIGPFNKFDTEIEDSEIIDAYIYDDEIYYTNGNEVKFYSIKNKKYIKSPFSLTAHSIVVLEKTFYIASNTGLTIYKKKSNLARGARKFNHSKILSIDYFMNPFTGKRFIGVFFNQTSKEINETFLEFYIGDNEENPIVNKLFADEKYKSFTSYLTFDSFFTYFLDSESKDIIVIRRGVLNEVQFFSYIIHLKDNITDSDNLFLTSYSIYNEESNNTIFPGIYNGNELIIAKNLTYHPHNMTCNLTGEGTYYFVFLQNTDVCQESLKSKNKDSICLKKIYYSINVMEEDMNLGLKIVIIVCVIIVLGMVAIFIFWECKQSKMLKVNNLKVNGPTALEKRDRKKLYEVDNEQQHNIPEPGINSYINEQPENDLISTFSLKRSYTPQNKILVMKNN